jgi:hypothetical protein
MLVQNPIRLSARGAHRRTLRGIEDSELDACLIGSQRHGAVHGVYFFDQMSLANSSNRGIAGHLAQRFDAMREKERATPHSSGSEGRFGAGVAATDHNDVEFRREVHRGSE